MLQAAHWHSKPSRFLVTLEFLAQFFFSHCTLFKTFEFFFDAPRSQWLKTLVFVQSWCYLDHPKQVFFTLCFEKKKYLCKKAAFFARSTFFKMLVMIMKLLGSRSTKKRRKLVIIQKKNRHYRCEYRRLYKIPEFSIIMVPFEHRLASWWRLPTTWVRFTLLSCALKEFYCLYSITYIHIYTYTHVRIVFHVLYSDVFTIIQKLFKKYYIAVL